MTRTESLKTIKQYYNLIVLGTLLASFLIILALGFLMNDEPIGNDVSVADGDCITIRNFGADKDIPIDGYEVSIYEDNISRKMGGFESEVGCLRTDVSESATVTGLVRTQPYSNDGSNLPINLQNSSSDLMNHYRFCTGDLNFDHSTNGRVYTFDDAGQPIQTNDKSILCCPNDNSALLLLNEEGDGVNLDDDYSYKKYLCCEDDNCRAANLVEAAYGFPAEILDGSFELKLASEIIEEEPVVTTPNNNPSDDPTDVEDVEDDEPADYQGFSDADGDGENDLPPVTNNSTSVSSSDIDYIDGMRCMDSYASCPDGYVNLAKGVRDGDVNLSGISQAFLKNAITKTYNIDDNQYRSVCIRSDISQNLTVRVGDFNDGNTTYDDGIPVACPSGWQPQRGQFDLDFLNSGALTIKGRPYGCCPSTHVFVNQHVTYDILNPNMVSDAQRGACCLRNNPTGLTPYRLRLGGNESEQGCYSEDNTLIYSIEDARNFHSSIDLTSITTEEQYYDQLANQPIIVQAYETFNADILAKDVSPQLGVSIGSNFYSTEPTNRITRNLDASETLTSCNPNSVCAVVFDPSGTKGKKLQDENGDTKYVVVNAQDFKDDATLTCQRCFSNNEFISLDKSGDNAFVCDSKADGLVRTIARGGLTIDQLKSLQGVDEINKPLQKKCLDQGGIYVAIGCIDPTPIGILTGLIRISLGVVGGVALIQVILAGLAYQSGNEEQIKSAQNRIFGTIGGLAVLIFSVLILRIIGVNVLDVVPEGLF